MDGENDEMVKSEDDTTISKKIVPSFPTQNKRVKNVKTLKSKISLKNSAIKKVTKKANSKKKTEETGNIDNSISDETLKTIAVNVDIAVVNGDTAFHNSEQIGQEQSQMLINGDIPACKSQSLINKIDAVIVGQDDAILKNMENRIIGTKDCSEIPKEPSIVKTSVAQNPPLESDLKNSDSSNSSETKQKSQNEDSEKFDLSDKKMIISSDTKSDEPSGESHAVSENCNENNDQTISNKQQNSSQNDVKSDILPEVETCQPVVNQDTLIQDQSSLLSANDSRNQNVEIIQVYKSNLNDSDHVGNSNNEYRDEVVNSDDKSVGPVEMTANKKNVTPPVKSLILTDELEEEEKKDLIVQSTEDFELNHAPKISGISGSNIKDPVIFENDDIDLTDSQLCATEWTTNGDSFPENSLFKKTDLAKFKRAEKQGTQIVNELITELSRLNKLLLHFKREIDAVWKRRKGSSVSNQQNVIKKRPPIQTLLGQFQ